MRKATEDGIVGGIAYEGSPDLSSGDLPSWQNLCRPVKIEIMMTPSNFTMAESVTLSSNPTAGTQEISEQILPTCCVPNAV